MTRRVTKSPLVAAPSDAVRGRRRSRLRVGGRIVAARRLSVTIADALGALQAVLRERHDLRRGDLAVLEGRLEGDRLTDVRVLERQRPAADPFAGEFGNGAARRLGPRLEQRSRAFRTIRDYLRREGFVEVDTPLRARTGTLEVHLDSIRAEGGWLITSPELHMKRLLASGLPRIYRLGHCFRAGELGTWHEPEFALLEWYRAFAEPEALMVDTERIVSSVLRQLSSATSFRLANGRRVDARPPFDRTTVTEVFRRHAGVADAIDLAGSDEGLFFRLLVERVEPALARRRRPVFVSGYPASQASLARLDPRDPRVADRFELYVGGVELCNAFGELTDPREQKRRFERDRRARRSLGKRVHAIDRRFLAALEQGLPRASGNALGVDRLIALACGARAIGDVQAFPAARL